MDAFIESDQVPSLRLAVDLTLEQTTNADATNQRTGIGAIKNSVSACQACGDTNFNHHRNNESVLTKYNSKNLFNIGSGKAASKETTSFLLHVTDTDNRAREEFVEECKSNPKKKP